ncbi:MAG TPA: molybdate ABC transporter permease subunit [Cytophagales bacterium]|nr:molybdate ABC transporter permease subunit [Cytophagales bacterium]
MNEYLITLLLTVKLAILTTIILLIIGIPIAYFLASSSSRFKPVIHSLISLPLVLPPTVIGYYLLVSFSPDSWLGGFLEKHLGFYLAFTFEGMLVGSIIYSLPFMIQPLESGLRSLPSSLKEASYTLGKTKWQTLYKVLLPSIKPSILSATILTFAHTLGEFGIVLMIGGSIPGETKVASIAIFNEVEALNYASANTYSLILFTFSFIILLGIYLINNRQHKLF